jgi:NTE family protein
MMFPPVSIEGELYLDGGLRQNTPIAPALRLGATHIFAVGSSREVPPPPASTPGDQPPPKMPGAAFLLGKILNAFLLDHIDADVELLSRINGVVDDGTQAFGPGFAEALSAEARKRGAPEYRRVNFFRVRPSHDIGRLAWAHMRRGELRGNAMWTKRLIDMLDTGQDAEADLASYMLFDGPFCRRLIDMGREDARARRDELAAFFGSE